MVDSDIIALSKRFCNIVAPSGYEDVLAKEIAEILQTYGYVIKIDAIGNLVCTMQGQKHMKKIAFMAHMDSAPIIINGVDGYNNVYWGSLSKWKSEKINNQSITFVSGATGIAHFSEEGNNCNTISDIKGHIEVGDVGVLTPFFHLENNIITATFLDDRIGCSILVDVAKKIITSPVEVSFVFTAQEEIGNKGSQIIASHFEFDEVYVIDTTRTLSQEYKDPVYVVMGGGGCVKICDGFGLCSKKLIEKIQHIAAINDIPLQKEVIFRGGSDIGAFSRFGFSTLFAGLSIPCVCMHSRHEQVCFDDVLGIENIILEILKNEQCQIITQ